ncbi:MAG: succinate dehydrogenase [Flavobacteriales bacterium]|nr:succinate dehydrogenase [Flavobacteriales bacterium]
MEQAASSLPPPARFGATDRKDNWWAAPLTVLIALSAFGVYATFRVVQNAWYAIDDTASAHILSPFYSPLIIWDGMPRWLSPGMLILWAPAGFRLTCYYYRKAYYRAFFLDPPACGVGEPRRNNYLGERGILILQNVHRYFLYLALGFIVILTWDVIKAMMWPDGFGVSVATLILLLNTVFLGLYTFSCHSLRHLVGGRIDCFSCAAMGQARHKAWKGVSKLNSSHMRWAWISLFTVMLADFYVWMVSSGVITDFRFF